MNSGFSILRVIAAGLHKYFNQNMNALLFPVTTIAFDLSDMLPCCIMWCEAARVTEMYVSALSIEFKGKQCIREHGKCITRLHNAPYLICTAHPICSLTACLVHKCSHMRDSCMLSSARPAQ